MSRRRFRSLQDLLSAVAPVHAVTLPTKPEPFDRYAGEVREIVERVASAPDLSVEDFTWDPYEQRFCFYVLSLWRDHRKLHQDDERLTFIRRRFHLDPHRLHDEVVRLKGEVRTLRTDIDRIAVALQGEDAP